VNLLSLYALEARLVRTVLPQAGARANAAAAVRRDDARASERRQAAQALRAAGAPLRTVGR
jgi:hypothetical protein